MVSLFICSLRARLAASDLEGVEFPVLVWRLKKHVICVSLCISPHPLGHCHLPFQILQQVKD